MEKSELPSLDLANFTEVHFSYWTGDDILVVHINAPRPAINEEFGSGWYLRVSNDGSEALGFEVHGVKSKLLDDPLFAPVFRPALAEVRSHADEVDSIIRAAGSVAELPHTSVLVAFVLGYGMAKLEAASPEDFIEVPELGKTFAHPPQAG